MTQPHLFIAADHRGQPLKAELIVWLDQHGHAVTDLGTHSTERCDAFDHAVALAAKLKADPAARGILICGSGQAMAMTANRYRHLRAALCSEPVTARLCREHNDANVLVLGADLIGPAMALECLQTFLATSFLGGRYAERRDKLTGLGGL